MIVQSIQQLRNRFYSGNRYVQGAQSVQVEVSPGESSVWVIGRSECAFYRIDFSAVEKNKRDAALANRIEILSPFAATGHWTFWDEESANVADLEEFIGKTISFRVEPDNNPEHFDIVLL